MISEIRTNFTQTTVKLDYRKDKNDNKCYFTFEPMKLGNINYIYQNDKIEIVNENVVQIRQYLTSKSYIENFMEGIKKVLSCFPSYIIITLDINYIK